MTITLEQFEAVFPNCRIESYWPGRGEAKIAIHCDGMISGIGESESEAMREFEWRNDRCLEEDYERFEACGWTHDAS